MDFSGRQGGSPKIPETKVFAISEGPASSKNEKSSRTRKQHMGKNKPQENEREAAKKMKTHTNAETEAANKKERTGK